MNQNVFLKIMQLTFENIQQCNKLKNHQELQIQRLNFPMGMTTNKELGENHQLTGKHQQYQKEIHHSV